MHLNEGKQTNSNKGFALLNIASAIVVTGLLIAAFTVTQSVERSNIQKSLSTRQKIEIIRQHIDLFAVQNTRLPCPALLDQAPGDETSGIQFGEESRTAQTCSNQGSAQLVSTPNHFRGAVPVFDLGLPLEYMSDGWGNKIEYAVSSNLVADSAIEGPLTGGISLNSNARSYLILSRGENGCGAYKFAGSAQQNPDCTTTEELENLDLNDNYTSPAGDDIILGFSIIDFVENINKFCLGNCLSLLEETLCSFNINSCNNLGRISQWQNTTIVSPTFFDQEILIDELTQDPYFDLSEYDLIADKTYIFEFDVSSVNIPTASIELRYVSNSNVTALQTFSGTTGDGNYALEFTIDSADPSDRLIFVKTSPDAMSMQLKPIRIYPKRLGNIGSLKYQYWDLGNITSFFPSVQVETLINDADFPNSPDLASDSVQGLVGFVPIAPSYGFANLDTYYGTRLFGYFTPDVDGEYQFRFGTSAGGRLYLNPADETAAKGSYEGEKSLIGISDVFDFAWTTINCSSLGSLITGETISCGTGNANYFNLKAGESYWIEALQKGSFFSNYLYIQYRQLGNAFSAIPGSLLSTLPKCLIDNPPECSSYYEKTTTLSAAQSQQPADAISMDVDEVRFVRLDVLNNYGASNFFSINEIRFVDSGGNIIDPSNIRVYRYHAIREGSNLDDYNPYNLLNNTSITSANITSYVIDETASYNGISWQAEANKDLPWYVVFDLGKAYSLQSVYIWNSNETGDFNKSARDIKLSATTDLYFLLEPTDLVE